MNHELLSLVLCPRCRGTVEIAGDPPESLRCTSCGSKYPVVGRVPRLAGDTYAASFGRQWNRYDVARPEEDEATFRVKTGVDPASLAGKLVLDAGCGGGRYARLVGSHGARVIGVDLSSAVDKAASLCAGLPDVCIVQADLLDLPLADAAFDLVFSIGVLHHTPDPRRAFAQIARKVKPGGRLAVWLYRKNTPPQEWLNSALRAVTTRIPATRARAPLRGPGRPRQRPGPEPDPQQGGQLLEPPRLDPPRLRQLRLVRPALPVAPHRRRAEILVRARRDSTTSPSSPPPRAAGSTTGPTGTT